MKPDSLEERVFIYASAFAGMCVGLLFAFRDHDWVVAGAALCWAAANMLCLHLSEMRPFGWWMTLALFVLATAGLYQNPDLLFLTGMAAFSAATTCWYGLWHWRVERRKKAAAASRWEH